MTNYVIKSIYNYCKISTRNETVILDLYGKFYRVKTKKSSFHRIVPSRNKNLEKKITNLLLKVSEF